MTSTLIKTDSPSAKMNYFTGMESLSFKMVSILFIIILNTTALSSQVRMVTEKNCSFIQPTIRYQKTKSINNSVQPKVYTVLFAKKFPLLENLSKQELLVMDDTELFDYVNMFCIAKHVENPDPSKPETLAKNR